MTRRRQLGGPICVGLGVGVLALVLAHLSVSRRVDEAIAAARSPEGELRVEHLAPHDLLRAPRDRLWANTQSATDGAMIDGHLFVGTSGGLIEIDGASSRVRTSLSDGGIADHDVTAIAPSVRGNALALGTRSGVVVVVEGSAVSSLQVDDGRHGAVVDVVWTDEGIIVGTSSGAVVRLASDFRSARLIEPVLHRGLTTFARGPLGVIVADGDGAVYRIEDERMVQIVPSHDEHRPRLTSLSYRDHRLLLGSPTGLMTSAEGGPLELLREGVFVTSILDHGDEVYVGTLSHGVLVLDASRLAGTPVRRLLPGRSIRRLRLVEGHPMAFGPNLVARLDATLDTVQEVELPRGIASNHITALAFDAQRRIWVGHFDEGIDVLDDDQLVRHLPDRSLAHLSNINDIAFDSRTSTMLVATSRGVLEVGDSGVEVLDEDDGLIGHSVTALLVEDDGRVFATSRGLTVAAREGGDMRSLYAFHGLPSNRLYALARAADGIGEGGEPALAVGSLGGVALLDGLRVTKTISATAGGIQANWCSALAATTEGIYVGTTGGGVDLLRNDGRVERIARATRERLTVNPGAMIVVDDKLLVGTERRGLLIYDRRRQVWHELEGGLPNLSVTAFALDDQSLYVGTNRGLLRLGRELLDEV